MTSGTYSKRAPYLVDGQCLTKHGSIMLRIPGLWEAALYITMDGSASWGPTTAWRSHPEQVQRKYERRAQTTPPSTGRHPTWDTRRQRAIAFGIPIRDVQIHMTDAELLAIRQERLAHGQPTGPVLQ
jgi:hypothetical protein